MFRSDAPTIVLISHALSSRIDLLPTPSHASAPGSDLVDAAYLLLSGMEEGITTLELFNTDPDGYQRYCTWYEHQFNLRRLSNQTLSIETRLAAYLRLIGVRGQRFHLGVDAIPSAKWLRERFGLHRNTMGKYIKDAQAKKPLQLGLTVGCQLAFAAAIYPRVTKRESIASDQVLQNRLDLIDDYHLSGRKKVNMVRHLTPIVYSGKNDLFTLPKNYPGSYDLDAKMRPLKLQAQHTPRRVVAKSKPIRNR